MDEMPVASYTSGYLQSYLPSEVFTRGYFLNTPLDLFLRNRAQLVQFQGFFLIFRFSSSLVDTLLLPAHDYQYGIHEFREC